MADPIAFDTDAARRDGVSDADIAAYLAPKAGFDLVAARKDGVNDAAIVDFLAPTKAAAPAREESRGTWGGDIKAGFAGTSQAMAGTVAVRATQEIESLKKQIDTIKQGDPDLPAQLRHLAPNRQRQVPLLEKRLAEMEKRYADAVSEVAQDAKTLKALPANEPLQRFTGGDLGEFLENPGAVARGLIGQSLTAMVPLIVGVALGGPAGGAIAGGVTGVATGGGQQAVRILAERGVDATDADAVRQALANPDIRAEIDKAFGMGQAIEGAVGTATGGLGGVTVPAKSVVGAIAKNVGLQAVGQGTISGAGEAATQGIIEGEFHPGKIAAAALSEALFAPVDAAAAAAHARGQRPKTPDVRKILDAPDADAAIVAALEVVEAPTPVDVEVIAGQARDFGSAADQQQGKLLQLFGGLNEGVVEQTGAGAYRYTVGDQTIPLKVWDEKVPAPKPAEGEAPAATISPRLAAAQRNFYGKMGIDVVYFEDAAQRVPFDGAVDPQNPNTIHLSNNPQRNIAQVGAHEVTHVLENTKLPDGTNLGDLLHQQVRDGLTREGWDYAASTFGITAPRRADFPAGPDGAAAHVDAIVGHVVREMGADIGAEAPKFQTFIPRVIDQVQQRYGTNAAKDVLGKLLDGIRQAMRTMREFFFRPDEMAEYGQPATDSQRWVKNLDQIHDTLAKMYATRLGAPIEGQKATLAAMREKAQQERALAAAEYPLREEAPPAAPEGFLAPIPILPEAEQPWAGAQPRDVPAEARPAPPEAPPAEPARPATPTSEAPAAVTAAEPAERPTAPAAPVEKPTFAIEGVSSRLATAPLETHFGKFKGFASTNEGGRLAVDAYGATAAEAQLKAVERLKTEFAARARRRAAEPAREPIAAEAVDKYDESHEANPSGSVRGVPGKASRAPLEDLSAVQVRPNESAENAPAGRTEAAQQRPRVRERLSEAGETGSAAVPKVRNVEGGEAPSGLQPTSDGRVDVPAVPSGASPRASDRGGFTEIGRNHLGQTLYEDARGVRSTLENGVRMTEPVGLKPGSREISVNRTNRPEYQVAEPKAGGKVEYEPVLAPPPEARPEPRPEHPDAKEAQTDHRLADRIALALEHPEPLTARGLQELADRVYGGTLGEGAYTRDRFYDAVELGVNRYIQNHPERFSAAVDVAKAKEVAAELAAMKETLPTQTVRAGEKDAYQQFSTPPDYAYAANWVANLKPTDHVLEPSAGVGGLIVHAMNAGVRETTVNELSDKRRGMIAALNPTRITGEDAAQLHNILPADIRPTVVVMNPPFSRAAERMGGKMVADEGAKHIEQALARLEPGGRLVAIVGDGMKPEGTVTPGYSRDRGAGGGKAFRDWWTKIEGLYDVRANVGVDREIYTKYGTSFPTRFLVIDKNPPSGREMITGQVQDAAGLIERLKEVRDERIPVQPDARQPGRPEVAAGGEGGRRPERELSRPTGELGTGEGPGARAAPAVAEPAGAAQPGERGERPADGGGEGGAVRDGVVPVEPERGAAGAGGQPGPDARARGESEGRSADRGGDGLRPDGSGERDEPGVTPAPEDVIATENATASPETSSEGVSEAVYENYRPQRIQISGAKPHPGALVQSAAMASVLPPKTDYKPRIPADLVKSGALSDAQLEAIVYAGHAHSDVMPDGKRRGFFIGDGTGVGKGREIAGILLDNKKQGRTKALWISEKRALLNDAKRDWSGLLQPASEILDHGKTKAGDDITAKSGILFTTYDTLKSAEQTKVEGEKLRGRERVDQIIAWLGKDFDGVIAFDESHNLGNSTDEKGKRGVKKAAQKALAGVRLQAELPNARVVYVSATGATEVSNLAYADRLGLWGEGTAFPTRNDFVGKVSSGGMAAMELVARDMKALGHYIARSLSYDGVNYDRVEHVLSPDQRVTYDKLAEGWQVVLADMTKALEMTGATQDGKTMSGKAKSAMLSAFWGGHQRFFNQIITSMQMPSVIKGVEADIKAKRQAVLQIVNTMEAAQERQLDKAKRSGEGDLEDLDMTPRDQLMQLVEKSFPVQQMEEYIDDKGNRRSRGAVDSKGEPVVNREAVAMREKLLDDLGGIKVPDGPLEMLLNHFGVDKVAEVTGRGQRVVRNEEGKTILEKRGASANVAEANDFQEGKKPILIFSEAGGTGRSYHAAIGSGSENARRSHYLVQGGWRADKAVQGFGRTHRTSQASAPIFHLVTTDLQGQKRFISSIARRLGQLGALTKGERRTGDQGMFGMRDNLESDEARTGLRQFFRDVNSGAVEGVTMQDLEKGMGLKMRDPETGGLADPLPEMSQFLNRVLSLKIEQQNRVFDAFSERMDQAIDRASAAGTLDSGVETYKADKITKQSEQTVYTDERSGAETQHVHLIAHTRNHPVDFDATLAGKNKTNGKQPEGFVRNNRSDRVFAVTSAGDRTDADGRITSQVRLTSPIDYQMVDRDKVGHDNWEKLTSEQARPLWDKQVAETPEYRKSDLHLITGAVLPIWDRLGGNPKIYRLQTAEGERLLGRVIPASLVDATLERLGAEGAKVDATPGELADRVLAGATAKLANDWTIKSSRVAGERRIEVVGPDFQHKAEFDRHGIFSERIQYVTRYFIPTEPAAAAKAIEGLTKTRPVTSLTDPDGGVRFSPKAEPENSAEYEAASAAHRTASAEFRAVTEDYRARRIGDAEFLAARAKFNAATKAFDAAYEKEAARAPEPEGEAAPDDRQSTLFSPKQTETPEFKRWFADSKVVDEKTGKPTVMYHGTTEDVSQFKTPAFFTPDAEATSFYSMDRVMTDSGAQTIPVYLSIRNPIDATSESGSRAFIALAKRGGVEIEVEESPQGWIFSSEELGNANGDDTNINDLMYLPKVREQMAKEGYDGLHAYDVMENSEILIWVPLDSSQIKSATGNRGTFDATNPDIRYSPKIAGESGASRPLSPEERKAFENVGRAVEPFSIRNWFDESRQNLGKRIIAQTLDPYIGVKANDPVGYMALRNANTSAGATEVFKAFGTLKFDGNAYALDKRNGGVENDLVRPLKGEAHDFIWWVAANRAERLSTEDRENLWSGDDIAVIKKTNRGNVEFDYKLPNGQTTRSREAVYADSLRKLDTFNKNTMDLAVQSGLLPRDKVDALWSNPFYVPFYRQADGDKRFIGPSVSSGFVKQSAFKTLKGGSEKLNNDLWENAFGNWQHMIDASLSNRAVSRVLDVAAGPAGAARLMTLQEVNHLSDKELKVRTVWVMKDGKKVHYEITDPMLFKAVSALDSLADPLGVLTAGRWFKKVLTVGVTMNPGFAVRNLIRDTQQTLAVAPSSANVFGNLVKGFRMNDLGGALTNVGRAVAAQEVRKLDLSNEAVNAIAGGSTMRLASGSDTGIRDTKVRTMLDTPEAVQGFWNYISKLGNAYRDVIGQGEDVNRFALYSKLRAEGIPHDAASFAARDLADFTLSGAATPVRYIIGVVPFLNARLQGLYKVGRSATNADAGLSDAVGLPSKSSTGRLAVVLGASALAMMALDAIYKDDEDYKKRTEFDRNTYYWFKFGGAQIRIPMGFEIAALGRMAANTAEAFYDKDMSVARVLENGWALLGQNLQMNPIPQAVKPLFDLATNTGGTGRRIEPMGMEDLQPDQRYTANNTLAARGVSSAVNSIMRGTPGLGHAQGPSPIQLDYLVNAYGGWLATSSLGMADMVMRSLSTEPVRPARDTWAVVTQGMVATEPRAESRYVDMLYKQGAAIERAYATYKDMLARGQVTEATQFFRDNQETIQKHGVVSSVMRLEGNLNRQIRMITNNPNPAVTAEQKKLQIQQLTAMKSRAAEQVFGVR